MSMHRTGSSLFVRLLISTRSFSRSAPAVVCELYANQLLGNERALGYRSGRQSRVFVPRFAKPALVIAQYASPIRRRAVVILWSTCTSPVMSHGHANASPGVAPT